MAVMAPTTGAESYLYSGTLITCIVRCWQLCSNQATRLHPFYVTQPSELPHTPAPERKKSVAEKRRSWDILVEGLHTITRQPFQVKRRTKAVKRRTKKSREELKLPLHHRPRWHMSGRPSLLCLSSFIMTFWPWLRTCTDVLLPTNLAIARWLWAPYRRTPSRYLLCSSGVQ